MLICCCSSMMADSYDKHLKELITKTEERSDIDPDSFATDIKVLENELAEIDKTREKTMSVEKRITYKSILRGVLATAYSSMLNSNINAFDEETRKLYSDTSKKHFDRVLEDMLTLSKENSKDYASLVKTSTGSKYYGHNMLTVMLEFVLNNDYTLTQQERDSLTQSARRIFQMNGDRNSDAMLRLKELTSQQWGTDEEKQKYCRALVALRDSTKDIEAGRIVENQLDIAVNSIMENEVRVQIPANILNEKPFQLGIYSQNSTEAKLQVFQYGGDKNGKIRKERIGKLVIEKAYTLSNKADIEKGRQDFMAVRDTIADSLSLPYGKYLFIATAGQKADTTVVQITTLYNIIYHTPDGMSHLQVVDRISGHPLSGITVMLYPKWNENKHDTFTTDKNGEVLFKSDQYKAVRTVRNVAKMNTYEEDATDKDRLYYYNHTYQDLTQTYATLFTDRGLYRPGQTLHVSAIVYDMLGDDTKIKTDGNFVFILENPDGERIESDTLSPTSMGTLSHDFILPNGKLGTWHIYLKNSKQKSINRWDFLSSCHFNVEEYKRPTFSVEFPKDTTIYSVDDNINIVLNVQSLSGVPVQDANVSFTIEASKQNSWLWRMADWQHVALVKAITNETGVAQFDLTPIQKETIRNLSENASENEKLLIRITAVATDNAGESHQTVTTYLIPLKPGRKVEIDNKPYPLQVSTESIHAGESLDITFTPEHKDAYIIYYVVSNDKIVDSQKKVLNGTLKRTLKCTKEWGDGATIYIMYIKEGIAYQYHKTIKVPKPDKKLNLSWHTFRDHLTPGQQEHWTLTVKDKDNKPVEGANLMAAMYDASLDELNTFTWSFNIPFVTRITSMQFLHSDYTYGHTLRLTSKKTIKSIMPTEFDLLAAFQHIGGNLRSPILFKSMALSAAPMNSRAFAENEKTEATSDLAGLISGQGIAEEGSTEGAGSSAPSGIQASIRENFNETAFFYPNISTDAEGNAEIQFTLPESLTQWKFLGFAHTEDVRYGIISSTAVANKDFMVQPQMPRFIRTSDNGTIQARILNQSDTNISGTATMRLISAADENTVVKTQTQPFTVSKGKATTVSFSIEAGSLSEDVICEILASDGTCSDGERNLLPVLQTKELVTENIPFYIEGATKKDIDLSTLYNNNSETATDRTLEIGYTDNPALDIFRSLRATQIPQHENAPCYAAALYSNLVMLDIARKLSSYSDTLIKNFDKEQAQANAAEALQKLRELQLGNGSWSWFKGMSGSSYITLAVAEHLHKLIDYDKANKLAANGNIQTVNIIFRSALLYLNNIEQKEYKQRKEKKQSLVPTEFDLRYMTIADAAKAKEEMFATYLAELSKQIKNTTIYGRAKAACILQKYGMEKEAANFAESVKKYIVYKPGLGRYFATDRAYYSWQDYRLPTQLAAMRMLATIDKQKNQSLLPDMQIWLMRQKQTQLWHNPLNAIDAADYMLTYAKEESLREPDTLTVQSGTAQPQQLMPTETTLSLNPAQTGTTITIEKHSAGISWGYIRGTFTEEASKLNNYTTGELSIEQKLYVKQANDWVEITPDTELTIGSTVRIRNIIHADRDMDFISVTTKHPSCLEPTGTLSGYTWFGNRGGYAELHDTETNVFFDSFTRGTTTLDLTYYVTRSGTYHSGISTATCEYAPEFGGYTKTFNLTVK